MVQQKKNSSDHINIDVKELRSIIKNLVLEAIAASKEYMKKEAVRQQLQDFIAAKIASGEINDQVQLDEWFQTSIMALNALKMVPIEAYMPKNIPSKKKRMKP